MHSFFTAIIYAPLYNGLIFSIGLLPYHNVAIAVILFTCLIKIILFPLSKQSIKTQLEMKQLQPALDEIKEQYKDNRQVQAEKIMQLYRERKINPFAGIFLMLLQIPVLMALYYIFLKGGLPHIDTSLLYPFMKAPSSINMSIFGVSVFQSSAIFALLAAVSQFFQMQITLPKVEKKPLNESGMPDFKDELAKSMNMQMKYVMPAVIFFIAYKFSIVVSLYLITSSIFAIIQELYMRAQNKKKTTTVLPAR